MKKKALGRGLDVLLDINDIQTEGSSSINEIELSKISVNPNQPRREFNEEALKELADSIAEVGIIQPITLRHISKKCQPTKTLLINHSPKADILAVVQTAVQASTVVVL